MRHKRQARYVAAVVSPSFGFAVGRLHLIGPNPDIFFSLGVLATLAMFGIAYDLREAHQVIN